MRHLMAAATLAAISFFAAAPAEAFHHGRGHHGWHGHHGRGYSGCGYAWGGYGYGGYPAYGYVGAGGYWGYSGYGRTYYSAGPRGNYYSSVSRGSGYSSNVGRGAVGYTTTAPLPYPPLNVYVAPYVPTKQVATPAPAAARLDVARPAGPTAAAVAR
jgi:hypothetical protein